MMKGLSTFTTMAMGFLLASSLAYAQGFPVSFQADYHDITGADESTGTYYASPEGMRMEGMMDGEPQIMIVSFAKSISWMVMKEEGMYYELPFRPEDADSYTTPCPTLAVNQTMAGIETVQGRDVEVWHCEKARGGIAKVWFDPRLKASIRIEDNGSVFELRNIREGQVSSDLFQAPTGFTKFSMPGM